MSTPTTTPLAVKYSGDKPPATLRRWCNAHADRVYELHCGGGYDSGRPDDFVASHKRQLANLAREVDARFPDNEHVGMTDSGLVLRRSERAPPPEGLPEVDQAITDSMATASILDVLTETERWRDLHKLFGPLSGFEGKLHDPRKRFLTKLFCYGCNLEPTQTALARRV